MQKPYTIIALVLVMFTIACGSRLVAVGSARATMISQTDDTTAIRDAIARGLQAQRYVVEAEDEGRILARFERGRLSIKLMIEYSPEQFSITHVESTGLDHQVDPQTQQEVISPHYPRYVTRLEREIQSELGRPAREAEEALEEQREHQLALEQAETDRQAAVAQAQERERNRERRAQRRENRRQRWAEMNREQQETERERLRAEAARAEADRAQAQADAEYLRRQPPPQIVATSAPVQVNRMAFEAEEANQDSVALTPGFMPDPYVLDGRASGRIASRRLGMPDVCPGFWSRTPQHVITLPQGMRYFRVDVTANEDTTLAIVTPNGQVWCDDDGAGGHNPRLAGQFPAGVYAVYVGTYQANRRTRYSVQLSEMRAQPQQAVVRQQPRRRVQQAPNCRTVLLERGHHAAHLSNCEGAEPYCAAELLNRGHHPAHLSNCRGVEPQCAVALLRNGQHPAHLSNCR